MKKLNNTEAELNKSVAYKKNMYTNYEMCLGIKMVICIKQHLSNIGNSIHEKVKQHWGWVKNLFYSMFFFEINTSVDVLP